MLSSSGILKNLLVQYSFLLVFHRSFVLVFFFFLKKYVYRRVNAAVRVSARPSKDSVAFSLRRAQCGPQTLLEPSCQRLRRSPSLWMSFLRHLLVEVSIVPVSKGKQPLTESNPSHSLGRGRVMLAPKGRVMLAQRP